MIDNIHNSSTSKTDNKDYFYRVVLLYLRGCDNRINDAGVYTEILLLIIDAYIAR